MWQKLEILLKEQNINPKQLSEMIGFKNNSTIYSLKYGEIKKPSFELMAKIATALNVSLDYFKEE